MMLSHSSGHLWESSRGKNYKKELNMFVIIEARVSKRTGLHSKENK